MFLIPNMLKKLYIFLTNFHKPFLEAFDIWLILLRPEADSLFSIFFWMELSSPLTFENDFYPNFFEWYDKYPDSEDYIESDPEDYNWINTLMLEDTPDE